MGRVGVCARGWASVSYERYFGAGTRLTVLGEMRASPPHPAQPLGPRGALTVPGRGGGQTFQVVGTQSAQAGTGRRARALWGSFPASGAFRGRASGGRTRALMRTPSRLIGARG